MSKTVMVVLVVGALASIGSLVMRLLQLFA